jgi:hypothetical protein
MKKRLTIGGIICILVSAIPFLLAGCASKMPSVYQSWGQQLTEAYTVEDVSLILGSPPTRCDSIEPTPMIVSQPKIYPHLSPG